MSASRKDPVAVRIVDEHGLVAVVRLGQRRGAYLQINSRHPQASLPGPRLKGDTSLEEWTLDGLPLHTIGVYCRRGWHSSPVSVAAIREAVGKFRAGEPPTKLKLQRDALA